MDVNSASGMNQAFSYHLLEIQGKGSYQEGCPKHSTDPSPVFETVLEENATPNTNETCPYHLFKKTTVEELRYLAKMAFSLASRQCSNTKTFHLAHYKGTKIKWTKPADWPDDVYFGDPNNGKQNQSKPNKRQLIQMLVELFERLKLHEKMVQLLEKHRGKERNHPLTQLLKQTEPLHYMQDTATDNNKLMDSSESEYSNIQERQKKPQKSIINQGSKEERINFDVRGASIKDALGQQPAVALPFDGFYSHDVCVETNSQVCCIPDDARLNDCRSEKDEWNLNYKAQEENIDLLEFLQRSEKCADETQYPWQEFFSNEACCETSPNQLIDHPSDQASHGDTICSTAEVPQLREASADPLLSEDQDAEMYHDNQRADLVNHKADERSVNAFESMEWAQQALAPSLTLNATSEADIQWTADEEIYPDLQDLDNLMQCDES